jgi:hypothetical protein
MLSFAFFDKLFVTITFFSFFKLFYKKDLGVFYVNILIYNMFTLFTQKSGEDFTCKDCNFICSRKGDWDRHLTTRKHKNVYKCLQDKNNKSFSCKCGKIYNYRQSLYVHRKGCLIYNSSNNDEIAINENIVVDSSNNNEMVNLTNIVLEIVKSNLEVLKSNTELQKQNQDLQKQMIDVCKNIQPSSITTTNSNNNNNNKTFNLQVFLNEECKDAMNLKDFVNSFKLQLSDLELVGDEGFINGMTKVILAKLDGMDANTRPFHCTDLKRETVYVKEDDVWVREGPDNAKLAAAIKAIGHQNFFILKEYKALHPDCESTYSEFNDHYMNLIMKSAGCQKEDIAKVIKKLVKEIVIIK